MRVRVQRLGGVLVPEECADGLHFTEQPAAINNDAPWWRRSCGEASSLADTSGGKAASEREHRTTLRRDARRAPNGISASGHRYARVNPKSKRIRYSATGRLTDPDDVAD